MSATRPWLSTPSGRSGRPGRLGRARHRPRHRYRSRPRRRWLLIALVVLVILVLLVGGAAIRVATEPVPNLTTDTVLDSKVTFPGPRPELTWPKQGQAAVTVAGLGSLGRSGRTAPQAIASIAKVMTAYVILHDFPLRSGSNGFTATVTSAEVATTAQMEAQFESAVPVQAGETLTEVDLLNGLLVPSANNFALILADHDGGRQAFVAKMNATAHRLGMSATTYTDPSGLAVSTMSTASDQVVLAEAAMKVPVFAKIVAEKSTNLPYAGTVDNFDHLIGVDGFVGIKTGSETGAGGSFVFADDRMVSGHPVRIYGAVLGQDVGDTATALLIGSALDAAQKLADSAAASLSVRTVLVAGTPALTVSNAQDHRVSVVTKDSLVRLGWGGMTIPLQLTAAPVGRKLTAGQVAGTVTAAGSQPVSTQIVAAGSMPALTVGWRVRHMF